MTKNKPDGCGKKKFYVYWTPKWIDGDKIKICNHTGGVHQEAMCEKATFCNDCGCLIGYSQPINGGTPQYVFDRRKEPVVLEFNIDEINQILKSINRKPYDPK
jgi:hypothetical protein